MAACASAGVGVEVELGSTVRVGASGVVTAVGVAVGVGAGVEVTVVESGVVGSGPPQAAKTNAIKIGRRNVRLAGC